MTWMEMFNDLRSSPDIRRHYQFWFYLYPTGQPFWLSAAQLRRDLAEVRQAWSIPSTASRPWTRWCWSGTAWAGWSRKLQTIDSGNDYWNLASHVPLEQVKADPETRQKLARGVLLPSQPVDPPRGDHRHAAPRQQVLQPDHAIPAGQADPPAQDAGQQPAAALPRQPRACCSTGSLLKVETSIDSLSPKSPDLPADAGRPVGRRG